MKIKDLDYLPVTELVLRTTPEHPSAVGAAVSLYGHWCHVRYSDGRYVSVPASSIVRIVWA